MARGPKKHLKRLNAPSHWMLDKMAGHFAPRPSTGPHKLRECLPLVVFLRNRLKYALTYHETKMILKQRQVLVDGKVRTDHTYPAGFMDVVSIPKTGENFRLLYDVKGRYDLVKINAEEAKFKLCKVKSKTVGPKGVPTVVTHDARTIRYPDPHVSVGDTVQVDLASGRPTAYVLFEIGATVMITKGRNTGRVGTIVHRDRRIGAPDVVQVKDAAGHTFATLFDNVFVLGAKKSLVTVPKGKGVKLSIAEERDRRLASKAKAASA